MQAQTLVEVDALMHVIIAALAAAFVAVDEAKSSAIVAS